MFEFELEFEIEKNLIEVNDEMKRSSAANVHLALTACACFFESSGTRNNFVFLFSTNIRVRFSELRQ